MNRLQISNSQNLSILCGLLLMAASGRVVAEPTPAAVSGFNSYVAGVESRLAQQHRSSDAFLAPVAADRLRRGELIVEQITPSAKSIPAGSDAVRLARDGVCSRSHSRRLRAVDEGLQRLSAALRPAGAQARVLAQQGDRIQVVMRVRQKHVITVVMDTAYDVTFARLDAQHGYSISRSTQISEIDAAGTASERVLSSSQEHGFLWRLNTSWSYEERDGGLYMQIESVSLTRSIPTGLGWLIGPFVESVPRESLEFTLRATCNALRK
jgi:hypothetical protein